MQRNKLIYALADAALVVNSDHGHGGTWAARPSNWVGSVSCGSTSDATASPAPASTRWLSEAQGPSRTLGLRLA